MRGHRLTLALSVILLTALTACASPSRVTYIPEGGDYTVGDLPQALLDARPGAASRVMGEEAPEVRQEALADLRGHGEDASALADTLTSDFPTDDISLPFAVELGTFEGQPAWIVYEAYGEAGGELSSKRIWVFSYDDRTVLAAHSAP
ncbi:MAG: hypothetical protein EG823_07510 [Actinobacteria bacterium]|nr:hypothetical protein [Actinomycetota bacterium]